MTIPEKFNQPYNPQGTEKGIYKKWEESGFFNPDTYVEQGLIEKDAPSYTIVLPPPNVTGTLHMGHASMLAIEDILIRFARMQGKRTLWLPGTDHAAIATQSKVEEILFKTEGKNRHDLGREDFLKKVEAFAQQSHDTITNQVRQMGSSVDWTREAYTLDKKRNTAVNTVFKMMYEDGLIYQGDRIVNWDPKMQSNVSDDEIEYKEETTQFYYLKYGPFTIGTARPETKFGDKYVVMHPNDPRYAEYKHGDTINLEWITGPVTATIIKDESIDMEFGTGVMTVTPWHDHVDYEMAGRHNLDKEQIIDLDGKLLDIAGEFKGMHIKKARPLIIEKMQSKGLIEKIDDKYVHRVATNYRGGGVIEPQIRKQWFIDVNKEFVVRDSKFKTIKTDERITLKSMMQRLVEEKEIDILPDRFERVYFEWIKNLHDWCISRQIWYGHRVPVWYKNEEIYCGVEAPREEGWIQDNDTLDTWFSSGIWTFSTLGWPEKTEDLKNFHPTSVLETGYDILFFWVARMILMTGYAVNDIPFKTVYLHGLVRDDKGRKMSKSLGNIIDPLDMIEKYGADATRLSLIIGAAPGNDLRLSEQKIGGYKKFTNKIWNITRFILTNTENLDLKNIPALNEQEKTRLNEWKEILKDVTSDLENFRLSLGAEKLYHYMWHTLADIVIEENKNALKEGTEEEKQRSGWLLLTLLRENLIALHPFMPFVTEEVWQHMPYETEMLIAKKWPELSV